MLEVPSIKIHSLQIKERKKQMEEERKVTVAVSQYCLYNYN